MECVAGIVLYNPCIDRLRKNIDAIFPQVNEVLLIDNASTNIDDINKLVDDYKKKNVSIELVCNDKNKGIAYALNQILEYALKNKYPLFLTLDQDSISSSELILRYAEYYDNSVGQMTCNIVDEKTGTVDYVLWDNMKKKEVDTCITSGALNNTIAINRVGGFNSSLYIDGVDLDVSLKLRNFGYKILRVNYDGLLHELGDGKTINVIGKTIRMSHHSPWRNYYARRNLIYVARKYYKGLDKMKKVLLQIMYGIGSIVFEDRKIERIKYNFKGIIDGFKM